MSQICSQRVLWASTLPRTPFRERVAVTAASGHGAISMTGRVAHVARTREGLDATAMRAILDEHGVAVAAIESTTDWVPRSVPGKTPERACFALATALGAPVVLAGHPQPRTATLDELAAAFAALCDRAAAEELRVALEPVAWYGVNDLETAWRIVRAADRPNAGIVIDSWHHWRGRPIAEATLRAIPGERVLGVQLSDTAATAEADLQEESLWRRRLPGEGAHDMAAFVRTLAAMGVHAPVGVEWFEEEADARGAATVAARCARALEWTLAQVQ